MTALPNPARCRLAKLLGLLGSNHAGERDNAGRAAHQIVVSAGLTWHDVVAPALLEEPAAEPPLRSEWHTVVARCLAVQEGITDWEKSFLYSLTRSGKLSPKQRDVLTGIADRLRARGYRI